jgi:hypothetical protein
MPDVAGIPVWVRLKPEEPSFVKIEGEWMILGMIEDLPANQAAMIFRRTTGDMVEVMVKEHVMCRRVKHRGDTHITTYVIAMFE